MPGVTGVIWSTTLSREGPWADWGGVSLGGFSLTLNPAPSASRRAATRGKEPRLPADRRAAGRLQDNAVRRERG